MKSAALLLASLVVTTTLIASGPKGTVPRSSAARYAAHSEVDGVKLGAVFLTAQEARRAFTSDVNRCCLVVEVALYPVKERPLEVSSDDFALRLTGSDSAAKPSSAQLLASTLEKKARSDREIVVSPGVEVGYGSGDYYDPATGQRRGGGVYTGAGVGVGVGGRGNGPANDRDRDVMALELSEKGLPEGAASKPVAGYLYFQLSSKKKNATYQLEYTLNGNKVSLPLH